MLLIFHIQFAYIGSGGHPQFRREGLLPQSQISDINYRIDQAALTIPHKIEATVACCAQEH